MDQDLYLLLGVGKTATEDEIAKAYRRMALIYHPDKNDHPESVEHFKKIRAAFDVLSNKWTRADYDRQHRTKPKPENRMPTHSTTQQSTALNIFPTLCVIGGAIFGAAIAISTNKWFNSEESEGSDNESKNDK
ncbi:dnaJ homolog subfamily B member 5-like [Drosophila pseudoobscura]|uniref:DnaJ homolog subfamily B member 9 n=1 Tax=Drosophila pseudoobscura pseudoobscura TaxID=46245 RepID=A0A6I8VZT3_DROPS|nr:dnaJ homolog subfamily B member 5 [Drosophila pseudoobscura]